MDKSLQNALGPTSNEISDLGSDGNNLLEEGDLIDYINFIGQWSADIIPVSAFVRININDILFDNLLHTEKSTKTNKKMRMTESQDSEQREEGKY